MKNAYIALWAEEAVRNVEIFNGSDPSDMDAMYDDSLWELDEEAEVFIGIYEAESEEDAMNIVTAVKNTSENCIRLISLNAYINDVLASRGKA